jgi:hypothetical protein
MYIIGSRALAAHNKIPVESARLARADFDVFMSTEEYDLWYERVSPYVLKYSPKSEYKHSVLLDHPDGRVKYEIETDLLPSVAYIFNRGTQRAGAGVLDPFGEVFEALPMADLFATKRAHIHHPIHFGKNVQDYLDLQAYVTENNLKMDLRYAQLRKKETTKRVKRKSTPKLNMTNSEFFSDKHYSVRYFVIHDDIHEAVKHEDRPIYEKMKDDLDMALCLKRKWDELTHQQQIRCVLEESYVIATERYLLNGERDVSKAFHKALERVCTTLTSGWFRDFALNNYREVSSKADLSFIHKVSDQILNGTIKLVDNLSEDDVNYLHRQAHELLHT